MKARRLFWPVYALLLIGATLAGSEAIASFLAPSYPARDIRPIDVKSTAEIVYNDWDLRDRARTFARPPGVRFRSVLVGDSFLEGPFLKQPLSAFVEQRMNGAGKNDVEAINFGVSATGPPQYYYRIRDVGLALKPDAIVMAVYAGNDFVTDAVRRLAAIHRRAAAALAAWCRGAAHHLASRQPPWPLGIRPRQQAHRQRVRAA